MTLQLSVVITWNIGRDVALLGARVEHLAAHAAGVCGRDSVQADVVEPAVGGVWQRWVEAQLAPGTPEPVGKALQRPPRGLAARGRGRPPLSLAGRRIAVVSPGLSGPHAGPDLVAVVEAGRALGGAGLAVETGVVGVALPRHGAGVHTILPGTVSVA